MRGFGAVGIANLPAAAVAAPAGSVGASPGVNGSIDILPDLTASGAEGNLVEGPVCSRRGAVMCS